MRDSAIENGMPEQLGVLGRNTRIKPGETDKRKGKTVRLREYCGKGSCKIQKNLIYLGNYSKIYPRIIKEIEICRITPYTKKR